MGLVALKSLNFLLELGAIAVHALLLVSLALGILHFELLDHLGVRLLGVRFVVEVHLLLQLERLLELTLQLLKVGLRLVTLGLEELESTFPEGSFFVKQVALLLELSGAVVELAAQLFVGVGRVDLAVL